VRVPSIVLAASSLLRPALRRAPLLWLLGGAVLLGGAYADWDTTDNHKYLMAYGCLAWFASLRSQDVETTLARNGRLLVGLCFLFASAWKWLSPDYLDGRFFHYELLTDGRFGRLMTFVSGISVETVDQNHAAVTALLDPASTLTSVRLADTPVFATLGRAMTWWTIAIESVLAIAFLWPTERGPARLRHALLLLFVLSTYAIAPVIGFGSVLAILGFVQTTQAQPRLRSAYLFVFVLLEVYQTPWLQLLLGSTA
jgi:hypothetical protein